MIISYHRNYCERDDTDSLTHALLAYSLGILLFWRYNWLGPQYVTVVMADAFVPDLAMISLAVPAERVSTLVGVTFDWFAVHAAGGALVGLLVGVVLVSPAKWRHVFALFSLGADSHLAAGALPLKSPSTSYPLLWLLSDTAPPTPGLYLSSDLWPVLVAGGLALGLWILDRESYALRQPTTDEPWRRGMLSVRDSVTEMADVSEGCSAVGGFQFLAD